METKLSVPKRTEDWAVTAGDEELLGPGENRRGERCMKSDLYAAINQIAAERNIPREAILRGIEDAIITAYRRIAGTDQNVAVKLDLQSGDARVFERRTIVEEVEDPAIEVSLEEARRTNPEAQEGDLLEK